MVLLSKDKLGVTAIENVKLSHAKEWALRMQANGLAYHSIQNYKRTLKAIFYMAVQDDCLRKNPFDFRISEVLHDNTEPKVPLSPEQEKEFLNFIQYDKVYLKYYDEVVTFWKQGFVFLSSAADGHRPGF